LKKAFLILLFPILFIFSCEDKKEKSDDGELIHTKVNYYSIPDVVLDIEPFNISLNAAIENSSCYSFSHIDTILINNTLELSVWGILRDSSDCLPADIPIDINSYQIEPPLVDPFIIKIKQPDGSAEAETLAVRQMSTDPNWVNYTAYNSNIPNNPFWSMISASDGKVWISSEKRKGIFLFDGQIHQSFDLNFWEPYYRDVKAMDVDKNGNLWIGSYAENYIAKYDGTDWQSWEHPGWSDDVHSIKADDNGNVWVGTHQSRLFMFDGRSWTEHDTLYSNRKRYNEAIEIDSKGNVWVVRLNSEVAKYDGDYWTFYDLGWGELRDIVIDKYDHIWVTAVSRGLHHFDGENWEVLTPDNSLIPSSSIYEIEIDSSGYIWITSGRGLIKYDGSNWELFTYSNSGLVERPYSLAVDDQNRIWVGGRWLGITMYQNTD